LTAVGDTAEEADALYQKALAVLDEEAREALGVAR
jgi:dsDNA-binding SOS-regulon protein